MLAGARRIMATFNQYPATLARNVGVWCRYSCSYTDVVAIGLPHRSTFSDPATRSRPCARWGVGGSQTARYSPALRYLRTDALPRQTHRARHGGNLTGGLSCSGTGGASWRLASQLRILSRDALVTCAVVRLDAGVYPKFLWAVGRAGHWCWGGRTILDRVR